MDRIRTVAITGGTHGNESNGVQLARHLLRNPHVAARPSFSTTVMLTNVAAIEANLRYVEEDMNRCFLAKDLADETLTSTIETRRAKEINAALGPKGSADATDYIIDLHNTTANTGVALMISPTDELSHQLAAYLCSVDPAVRVCNWTKGLADYALLPTVGKHGMTFEVGPTPTGCVVGASYARSLRLLLAALDYLHAHNQAAAAPAPPPAEQWVEQTLDVFCNAGKRDFPRGEDGELAAMVHPQLQGTDFAPLRRGDPVFQTHALETIRFGEELGADDAAAADEPLYPYFVNESAYYEKGVAFALATREKRGVRRLRV
jgi:succinylglutamate desuccinylase